MKQSLLAAGKFLARWRRFVIPVGLVLAVTVFTVVMHARQSDDVTDHNFLRPSSSAPVGGSALADALAGRGVTLVTESGANQALVSAEAGNATVFIPAPSLLNPHQLHFLSLLPPSVTLVIVAADRNTVALTDFPVQGARARWSTLTAPPDCSDPTATAAGAAGVDGIEYRGDLDTCYHGGLAHVRETVPQVWLAGASDVFRNDRIGEAGNRNLAIGLLDTHPRLIWLDIHDPEPPPRVETVPPGQSESPDVINEGGGMSGDGNGGGGGDNSSGGGGGSSQPQHSVAALFPAWLWTIIGLAVLIMVVLALAASRRMGAPVTEPMPVTARLRESVEGRGRLYRRAKQPAVALDVLRRAAINQLPAQLGVPPTTSVTVMLDMVAERTGLDRQLVDDIVRDDQPRTNADLVTATRRLDDLMTLLAGSVGAHTMHTNRTDLT